MNTMGQSWIRLMGTAGALAGMLTAFAPRAEACGCFTPPDPSVPVVQAGERIVFASDGGQVVAHIQIQYAGDAKDFGWLLPLPSIPTLELGADELFSALTAQTQPKYRLTYANNCGNSGRGGIFPAFGGAEGDASNQAPGGGGSPLVVQDSVGPYDYAVLKADSKADMLKWLADNRYFVPAGTDAVVGNYIHPGAFFLALKLKSGKSTGDLQPVVVRYASDLPMIPIVLTSTAAQPDMGIQVWMLGKGRAIPRNYFHTVLNDAAIDWQNAGANYNDVVIRATKEAEKRHTFVTEFAGAASLMKGVLDPVGRFGAKVDLAASADAIAFVQYLRNHGFGTVPANGFGGGASGAPFLFGQPVFSGALLAILEAAIPLPGALKAQGVTAAQYYAQLDYFLGPYKMQNPSQFVGLDFNIDAKAMAEEVWKRVVTPTLDAAKLFEAPYLTRLYTTLSPEQMDSDPVFSFNPDLPDVKNVHEAVATLDCYLSGNVAGTKIVTEQGFELSSDDGNPVKPSTTTPASLRIEVLRESGAAQVITDNVTSIRKLLGQDGCSVAPGAAGRGSLGGLALLAGALGLLARRRRRG